jgi:hypothetical protein
MARRPRGHLGKMLLPLEMAVEPSKTSAVFPASDQPPIRSSTFPEIDAQRRAERTDRAQQAEQYVKALCHR